MRDEHGMFRGVYISCHDFQRGCDLGVTFYLNYLNFQGPGGGGAGGPKCTKHQLKNGFVLKLVLDTSQGRFWDRFGLQKR